MAAKSSTANGASPNGSTPNPFLTALAEEAAKEAGLRYCPDGRPGLRRERNGKNFIYKRPNGSRVHDVETLARIKRLVIPPAWTGVWICPVPNGHIQATGRDARRRKQYRYHQRWREQRDQNKFARMMSFAETLPRIRQRVKRDLALPGLPRNKVLATVVRLLETTLIRVGNDEYARTNRSYGLTTLRDHHVRIKGPKISFAFKGKSGKQHQIDLHDHRLAQIVKRSQDLPGEELFAYEDEGGNPRDVTSQDVNAYLREISGDDFTAKDFRTWAGTVLAALALREFAEVTNHKQAKRNVVAAIEAVAKMLGNTPAVCRKCYVHPAILDSYLQGTTIEILKQRAGKQFTESLRKLKPEEAAVLTLLRRGLGSLKASASNRNGKILKRQGRTRTSNAKRGRAKALRRPRSPRRVPAATV